MSLTKNATENDQNFSTQLVEAKFENKDDSISRGEDVEFFWFFYANRSNYNLKKVNTPENTVFYINQSYLTVLKSKKIYYCNFHVLDTSH